MKGFPRSSPDLNAIEGVWNLFRQRLEATQPSEIERRAAFLARLRRCVTWLNVHESETMLKLCTNQKERAQDVSDLRGTRTKW